MEPASISVSNDGIIKDLTPTNMQYYKSFIDKMMSTQRSNAKHKHQIQLHEEATDCVFSSFSHILNNNTTRKIYPYENHEKRLADLTSLVQTLNAKQKISFDIIVKHFTSDDPSHQLGMFLTGEGGTGKSKVIEYAIEFSRLYFGRQRGHYGPGLAVAQTGTASSNIGGFTWQSVTNKNGINTEMSNETAQKVGAKILGLKFIVIDEISLLSCEDFGAFEERIKKAILATISTTDILRRQQVESLPFGGLHLLICGDFYQLRCVSGVPLYNKSHALTSEIGRASCRERV